MELTGMKMSDAVPRSARLARIGGVGGKLGSILSYYG